MNHDIEKRYSIEPFQSAVKTVLDSRLRTKTAPVIVMQGGFGKKNTGDDTLLLVAKDYIEKLYPSARIVALCHNPEFLKQYRIEGVRFKSLRAIRLILSMDALIVPAGGLTNNIDYNSKLRSLLNPRGKVVLISLLISIIRGIPSILYGVGIHEIPDFIVYALLRITIPRVSVVGVRDRYSVDFLEKIGVNKYYFFHDPAICYKGNLLMGWNEYKRLSGIEFEKYIVLNIRLVKERALTNHVISEISRYLRWLSECYPDYGVVFLPFSIHPTFETENDVLAFKKVESTIRRMNVPLRYIIISTYQTANDIQMIASHAELLILARHHAPVLTYHCRIPTIILSYNIKCREFAELAEYQYVLDYNAITHDKMQKLTRAILGHI